MIKVKAHLKGGRGELQAGAPLPPCPWSLAPLVVPLRDLAAKRLRDC